MRIPRSVIVMTLVTAIPFGLAARDTLGHHTPQDLLDQEAREKLEARAAEQKAYEQAALDEEAATAAKKKQHTELVAQLIGDSAGTMGPLMAGIEIGHEYIAMSAGAHELDVTEDTGRDAKVTGVSVVLDDDNGDCNVLRQAIAKKWSAGAVDGIWLDPSKHVRATFVECVLRFAPYVEPSAWLAALPFDLVGKPSQAAVKLFGESQEFGNSDSLSWELPGLASGATPTRIAAELDNDRIMRFIVTAGANQDATTAMTDAISARLHTKYTHVAETDHYEWKRTVPITLDVNEGQGFEMMIGKPALDSEP